MNACPSAINKRSIGCLDSASWSEEAWTRDHALLRDYPIDISGRIYIENMPVIRKHPTNALAIIHAIYYMRTRMQINSEASAIKEQNPHTHSAVKSR